MTVKMLVPIKCCNINNYLTTSAIPVTASLNGNKDREYKGLYEALTRYGLNEVRQDIRSAAPLPNPQRRCGGQGNSTLVIGKLKEPETQVLYEDVQVGTKLLSWVCGE